VSGVELGGLIGRRWPKTHDGLALKRRKTPDSAVPLEVHREVSGASAMVRPVVQGKFLFTGAEKFFIRGVTYGPFKPGADGCEYHDRAAVERDFAAMSAAGLNAVRTYTVPPLWLLDVAAERGLRVMVGLPWEQHVTFLDDPVRASDIVRRVAAGVRACARHRAILCYSIGNEIPANIVRWHGHEAIERFISRLYLAVKSEDPTALVTYVNFPSTEYLRPRSDFVCFNVYLETRDKLSSYLARLQNLAGDRPLVMAEIGYDSLRHGADSQADVMSWQIETVFREGCAGAFAFSWTDEWYRGGSEITDWQFGLVDRERLPKPALISVTRGFHMAPAIPGQRPRVSVVVCTYNGSRTLAGCLDGLTRLRYPDYEIIVVDDGSTDDSSAIASRYDVRLIRTPNQGLSAARNVGARVATGEIVAYIDDDAWPDPDWLLHISATLSSGEYAGVGGPNIPPGDDGLIAACVANAPGGPVHVLLSDREAEHIPGCNMAFDRQKLLDVGGFDPEFRVAGDDVDLCWRLQARGWKLGFSPAAVVWHRRRNSARAYFRQQRGYGRAEALLERKWPEKYNAAGHVAWGGRIYAPYMSWLSSRQGRIYHGTWGTALFQSVYEPAPPFVATLMMMPEWYLLMLVLLAISGLGLLWSPLLLAFPALLLTAGASLVQAGRRAASGWHDVNPVSLAFRVRRWLLATVLHVLQPVARLTGRVRWGLTFWRWSPAGLHFPVRRVVRTWSEQWRLPAERVLALEERLKAARAATRRGSDFDAWDLEVQAGVLAAARIQVAVEEHGGGRQQVRTRITPRFSLLGTAIVGGLALLGAAAVIRNETFVGSLLVVAGAIVLLRQLYESSGAMALAVQSAQSIDP
jgi:O-antigen biosynthesis protein